VRRPKSWRITHKETEIRQWIAEQPDITLKELSERLAAAEGIELKVPTLWSQPNRWGLSFKKTPHASE
jgi:transposase